MIAIIETTINIPQNLLDFAWNFKQWGHKDIAFIIIGDMKSPPEIGDIEAKLTYEGFQAEYWDVERQLGLKSEVIKKLPLNSRRRRNIGTLLAIRYGAEWAIHLDDDNYPTGEDFIARHISPAGKFGIASDTHWYNTGELTWTQERIFLRGFPISRRSDETRFKEADVLAPVVANQGLCLETPDADAMTHIVLGEKARCQSLKFSVILAPGTFIPLNSQNTAIHRRALPACYLPDVGRNNDIIAGYILQKVAHSMGDSVSAGSPCTRHIRNTHNLLEDMEQEAPDFRLTEAMLPILEGEDIPTSLIASPPSPYGSSYLSTYVSLLEELKGIVPDRALSDMTCWCQDVAEVMK